MRAELQIKDLRAGVGDKEILKGVSLIVRQGELHAIMGPNGSGKSTLSNVIMGHPKYKIYSGDILLSGESILGLRPDQRANKGLFLGFQYPVEVAGVGLGSFLRNLVNLKRKADGKGSIMVGEFQSMFREKIKALDLDESFATRQLNAGFSGGEKKRAEVLQMSVLKPSIAILDEPDSGLDVDALKSVAKSILDQAGPELGILVITHYQRILAYLAPEYVHIMIDGRIARSGGKDLAKLVIALAANGAPIDALTEERDSHTTIRRHKEGRRHSLGDFTFLDYTNVKQRSS